MINNELRQIILFLIGGLIHMLPVNAQRTIELRSDLLQLGDTCSLYRFEEAQPLLVSSAAVTVLNKITLQDTVSLRNTFYVLVLPVKINEGAVYIIGLDTAKNILIRSKDNGSVVFENSDINNGYTAYMLTAKEAYTQLAEWKTDFINSNDTAIKQAIKQRAIATKQRLYNTGKNTAAAYKNVFVAGILNVNNPKPSPGIAWNDEYSVTGNTSVYKETVAFVQDNYWSNIDLRDTQLLLTPFLPAKTKEYAYLINVDDSLVVSNAITALLQKASVDPHIYIAISDALLEVYNRPNTYTYNEKMASGILRHAQTLKILPEWKQVLISSQLATMAKNASGSKAAELQLQDENNILHTLYRTKNKYTVLYFFDPDCSRCMSLTPKIKQWLTDKGFKTWAIYVGQDEQKWRTYLKESDTIQGWLNVWDKNGENQMLSKYWIESLPAIYVLDETKKVLLKNANSNQLFNFLTKKSNIK